MIKGWNYAGGKVPAGYKSGSLRRKLWNVRQPIKTLYCRLLFRIDTRKFQNENFLGYLCPKIVKFFDFSKNLFKFVMVKSLSSKNLPF